MNQPGKSAPKLPMSPSSGSRAALKVGTLGGAVLGLAAVASRLSQSAGLSTIGTFIIIIGLSIVGYYAARESQDFSGTSPSRTGGIAGLLCGLTVGVVLVIASLFQSLDPALRTEVIAQTNELMERAYSPERLSQMRASGVTVESVYPIVVVAQLLCCGALLPLSGLGLGAIGGAVAAQVYKPKK